MKWLPNAVSISRLALAPLIGFLIYTGLLQGLNNRALHVALILFIVSALTDWLDGYLARQLDAKSELGGKLDLWGDKILIGFTLLALWFGWPNLGNIHAGIFSGLMRDPWALGVGIFLILAIPVRDSFVTKLRAQLAANNILLAPTFAAKSKTAMIMVAMSVILFGLASGTQWIIHMGFWALIVGAALSIWTGLAYFQATRA
ncbi:CDP-alcohol phosphatidyltransferase family protein [Candidatus Phycosocius spiralis]|uniref:CDP-diacylglycerol--glycerol-3-phosphate 3-phosphatidyltransferase n=1 Tax=Candidatus Phycosocius spiralis TaxID=2815099 RepID=A0ABQ4PTK6_9PROT|nr:CDP-alcohol phosphatidyltransferase family protein [Candidatus Phycosocius spiralis]GIU66345.1 CDP-diacylglycerol--glycerol-3-phosphate 3-phosphatidyltransferase [Candidatus Phycosocius spiralis]